VTTAARVRAPRPDETAYHRRVEALFARRPEVIVPGLARIRALCRALGEPQHSYECVHITGTNGKTSTARMVTALLRAAGLHVGTYTSPHLQDVRERIRLDGAPVDRARFLAALGNVEARIPAAEAAVGQEITFFEVLTAVAAHCFQAAAVDTAVLEVGMGGLWDATNVHDARVAVIGRVGLDHPELGDTHAEVAAEKAGIIKDGADVVVGPQPPDAARVIARAAARRGARVRQLGADFGVMARLPVPGGQDVLLRSSGRTVTAHLPLHGAHQAVNAACALAAADAVLAARGGVPAAAVRAGFAEVRSQGRFEVFERPGAAPVILDGAHNPEGAGALVEGLCEAFAGRRVVAVIGVLADKDVVGMLGVLLERADDVILTRVPRPRAASPEALAEVAGRFGREVVTAPDVGSALGRADELAAPDDAIVVTGSLYLVGAVRGHLGGAIT
jgi:dihydrofolate synthase / folylpolyglutamate synthase